MTLKVGDAVHIGADGLAYEPSRDRPANARIEAIEKPRKSSSVLPGGNPPWWTPGFDDAADEPADERSDPYT